MRGGEREGLRGHALLLGGEEEERRGGEGLVPETLRDARLVCGLARACTRAVASTVLSAEQRCKVAEAPECSPGCPFSALRRSTS